jgi:hypothetical protein
MKAKYKKKSKKYRYTGYTQKQKEWIKKRDDYECQFINLELYPPEICGSKYNLEVHHIIPVAYATLFYNMPEEEINAPENGITLCKNCHLTKIHPDFGVVARKQYRYTDESYDRISEQHFALAKAGVPYWQTDWDSILSMTARIRTFDYLRENPDDPFPLKKKKK